MHSPSTVIRIPSVVVLRDYVRPQKRVAFTRFCQASRARLGTTATRVPSHLVEHLLGRGDRVVVVDDLSTGRLSNLDVAREQAGDRLGIHEGTVSEVLPELDPQAFDGIHHLAAAVGVRLDDAPAVPLVPAAEAALDEGVDAEAGRIGERARPPWPGYPAPRPGHGAALRRNCRGAR